jgi:hypothetical protein
LKWPLFPGRVGALSVYSTMPRMLVALAEASSFLLGGPLALMPNIHPEGFAMVDSPKGRRLTAEMITAFTAVIIGVGAIGVSIYETTLVRQQLKGSAWPNVEVGFTYNEEGFRYLITNTGVGPARIQYAEITVDEEPVGDWGELFERLELDVGRYSTSYITRGALPPGTIYDVLVVGSEQPAEALYRHQGRIRISACYCSVYDDCWIKSIGEDPIPVRVCGGDADSRFRN